MNHNSNVDRNHWSFCCPLLTLKIHWQLWKPFNSMVNCCWPFDGKNKKKNWFYNVSGRLTFPLSTEATWHPCQNNWISICFSFVNNKIVVALQLHQMSWIKFSAVSLWFCFTLNLIPTDRWISFSVINDLLRVWNPCQMFPVTFSTVCSWFSFIINLHLFLIMNIICPINKNLYNIYPFVNWFLSFISNPPPVPDDWPQFCLLTPTTCSGYHRLYQMFSVRFSAVHSWFYFPIIYQYFIGFSIEIINF